MECIRIAKAQHKVIIFCKSHPLNWQLEDNNQQRNQASLTTMTTRLHDTSLKGVSLLLKFPTLYDNKYVFFYSLWPCYFIPSLYLVAYIHMLFCFAILIIMAGFGFDDDDFSLSGLTQEGHDNVVTVINSSSSDDENYDGLLECARKLAGETSDKSSMEGSIQGGVEPGFKPGVKPGVSNMLIPKMSGTGLLLSNDMASSLSQSEQSNDVSFIYY